MKNQTIGVEIEMTGTSRENVAKAIAEYFGTTKNYIGGTYKAYEVKDNEGRTWTIARDSSIRAEEKINGVKDTTFKDYKVELVTPILKYNDIETLQEVVRKVRKAGAFVNETCGLHIHIGASKFTPQTVRNLVNAIASKEDILLHALKMHESRIRYCKKTNQRFLTDLNEKKPETMAQLAAVWYDESERMAVREHGHYDSTRYTICNLHALFTKGTIEFRCFNSTLHAGEVKAAIQFCLALTHQALTTKKAICRKTISDNEKYTFRCWLLRLGLNGDEFKTCRLHMTKHLEGNSAWRNGAA